MAKSPIRRRPIRAKKPERVEVAEMELTAAQRQMITAVNYITEHPQYPNIIAAIRMGTSNGDIADHFLEKGHFNIARKTALLYLSAFRRAKPQLCKPRDIEEGENPNNLKDYDHIFDGNALALTEETELLKLIQLQKSRVSIDFEAERRIGKLFSTTQKEIQVLGELVEKLAKVRGTIKPASQNINNFNLSDDEVRDGIAAIRADEAQRKVIQNTVNDIMQKVRPKV